MIREIRDRVSLERETLAGNESTREKGIRDIRERVSRERDARETRAHEKRIRVIRMRVSLGRETLAGNEMTREERIRVIRERVSLGGETPTRNENTPRKKNPRNPRNPLITPVPRNPRTIRVMTPDEFREYGHKRSTGSRTIARIAERPVMAADEPGR